MPARNYLNSVHGNRVRLLGRILRLCEQRWRTVKELREHLDVDVKSLRSWLRSMYAEGILHMRNRPRTMREDGDKASGPWPREFKVPSKWGEL